MLVPEDMDGLYHVVSRVVDRRRVFGEEEKRHFRRLLLAYAEFSGITIVAWCLLGNHFHLLLELPAKARNHPAALSEDEVVRRVALIHGPEGARELERQLAECSTAEGRKQLLVPYTRRMGDLGLMMKSLKQRFTQWFNRRHDRRGTLWEDRYRSVIVENAHLDGSMGGVAKIVAAYIDLNPVRAGIVEDPSQYPWSGFGAFLAGDAASGLGLARLWGMHPEHAARAQAGLLYEEGKGQRVSQTDSRSDRNPAESNDPGDNRSGRKKIRRVAVPLALRRRVRHFTAGAVLGSRAFVERVSSCLGIVAAQMESGEAAGRAGISVPGGDWGSTLRSLRALRVRQIGIPDVVEKE